MALKEKRQGKLRSGVRFHWDNARVHTSSQVLAAIQNAGFDLLRHPSYSTEVTPIDFYFFYKLKEFMKECKFTNDKDVVCAKNGWLEEQDQQFCNGIRALEKCRTNCIPVAGDCVKK